MFSAKLSPPKTHIQITWPEEVELGILYLHYIYTHMQYQLEKKEVVNLKKKQGVVYGRVWTEEKEKRNVIIVL